MSEISDANQLVCKHRTKNFSCGIVFIIYVLRLNALFKGNSVEDTRTVRESYFRKQCKALQGLLRSKARPAALHLLSRPSFLVLFVLIV